MKSNTLCLAIVLVCLSLVTVVEGQALKLDAPAKWRTESVNLPPRFAKEMELKGKAKVFFSPGWGKKKSEQFFTCAFLFQTEAEPKIDEKVVEKAMLSYLGGLAKMVSRGKIDPSTFKMTVKRVAADADADAKQVDTAATNSQRFNAMLKWTEPFVTKSAQTLNMEVVTRFDTTDQKNYLLICTSPQDPKSEAEASSKVWKEFRKIQASFIKNSQKETPTPTPTPAVESK